LRIVPDGPRYDEDFYAWTQYQAVVLRTLATSDNRFDREHLAEEIEDLGNSERNAMRSEVRAGPRAFSEAGPFPRRRSEGRLDGLDRERPCGA
jgi:hypothetical protein